MNVLCLSSLLPIAPSETIDLNSGLKDGVSTALYDLTSDPGETENLLDSSESLHQEARRYLESLVATFPGRDGAPRYDPLPPQPWDLENFE